MFAATIVSNRIAQPVIQRKKFAGHDHIVFPAVMLREQVLNCLNCDPGGEFVPAVEIMASVPGWEGRPIVIYEHPTRGGEPVSANRREVLEREQVGYVFDVRWDDDALKGDVWLNAMAMGRMLGGSRILERIEAGEMLEVSTGYFRKEERKKGVHGGRPYAVIQRNLIPDHFAIGLWNKGACSVEHGCGAPRLNEGAQPADCGCGHPVLDNSTSEEADVTKSVIAQLRDVFARAADVLTGGEPAANGSTTGGDPAGNTNQESAMRTKVITILAGIAAVGLTAEQLSAKTDQELESLLDEHVKPPAAEAGTQPEGEAAPAGNKGGCGCKGKGEQPAPAANGGTTTTTTAETTATQPAANGVSAEDAAFVAELRKEFGADGVSGLKSLLANAKADAEAKAAEKAQLVTELKGNSQCAFSEAQLKALDLDALRALQKSLGSASYAGRGGPRTVAGNSGDDDGDVPEVPAVLLAKPAAK